MQGGGRQEGVGVSEVLCRGYEGRKGWVLVRCYAGGRGGGGRQDRVGVNAGGRKELCKLGVQES